MYIQKGKKKRARKIRRWGGRNIFEWFERGGRLQALISISQVSYEQIPRARVVTIKLFLFPFAASQAKAFSFVSGQSFCILFKKFSPTIVFGSCLLWVEGVGGGELSFFRGYITCYVRRKFTSSPLGARSATAETTQYRQKKKINNTTRTKTGAGCGGKDCRRGSVHVSGLFLSWGTGVVTYFF